MCIHLTTYIDDSNAPDIFDSELINDVTVGAAHAAISQDIGAFDLSKMWSIDLDTAQRTLNVTTQL